MTRLLHVTDCLPGRDSLQFVPQEALYRGKWVHDACHILDTGRMTPAVREAAPEWWGYVEAWEKCKRETGAAVLVSEKKVCGRGYTGTLDKIITIAGARWEVWDLKCGGPEAWHGLQLAAYEVCVRTRGSALRRRCCHLSADGTYQLIEHKGKDDLRDFLAYLRIAYYEINHGLRSWPALREGEIE